MAGPSTPDNLHSYAIAFVDFCLLQAGGKEVVSRLSIANEYLKLYMHQQARSPAEDGALSPHDRELVSEVLRKDRKASAEFVGRCADYAYPFVRHAVMPRAEVVEDLMQEILLAAWQNLGSYRGDASLRSWILGIARHKVEDYYRKRIRQVELPDGDDNVSEPAVLTNFEAELEAAERQERVHSILALMPETYSIALLWRYRDDKSVREIAEFSGKTEKAIERLLARARQSFRRGWSDDRRQY
jgi:RNA polymerase sigma-70 factor, ECF subfamily